MRPLVTIVSLAFAVAVLLAHSATGQDAANPPAEDAPPANTGNIAAGGDATATADNSATTATDNSSNATDAADDSSSATDTASDSSATATNTSAPAAGEQAGEAAQEADAADQNPANTNATDAADAAGSATGNDTTATGTQAEGGEDGGDNTDDATQTINARQDIKIGGLTDDCAKAVFLCFMANAPAQYGQNDYCQAYSMSRMCMAGNVTNEAMCSDLERALVEQFSCSPGDLDADVSLTCQARMSQCASSILTVEERAMNVTDELFRKKTCNVLKMGTCLKQVNDGAVCTEAEVGQITEAVECSACSIWASALIVAAMLVLGNIL